MKKSMTHSWQAGKKVDALKTVIRAAKMMGDYPNDDILNYPVQFMHVVSLLDEFGKLVYNHIKSAASYYSEEEVVVAPPPPSYEDCGGVIHDTLDIFARDGKILEYRAGEARKKQNNDSNKINSTMRVQVSSSLVNSVCAAR